MTCYSSIVPYRNLENFFFVAVLILFSNKYLKIDLFYKQRNVCISAKIAGISIIILFLPFILKKQIVSGWRGYSIINNEEFSPILLRSFIY